MTEYIKNLRKTIGHAPILQCGASVIVENEQGEILLQLRKDNHFWGYAGGSVELDEEVEEAAKRELYEETGLISNELELFGVFSGKDMHYIYPNGDEVSNIDIVYICRSYSGDLKMQKDEVTDLKFFPLTNLPENISPPNIKALKAYIGKRNE
jgi:8-oxo-dGTP pyrophosphatase MutT (NUDIX family)